MITTIEQKIKESTAFRIASQIIEAERLISDRVKFMEVAGFDIESNVACGSGGVGTVRIRRDGMVHLQISAGKSQWNYATVAILGHVRDKAANHLYRLYNHRPGNGPQN